MTVNVEELIAQRDALNAEIAQAENASPIGEPAATLPGSAPTVVIPATSHPSFVQQVEADVKVAVDDVKAAVTFTREHEQLLTWLYDEVAKLLKLPVAAPVEDGSAPVLPTLPLPVTPPTA